MIVLANAASPAEMKKAPPKACEKRIIAVADDRSSGAVTACVLMMGIWKLRPMDDES